MYQFPEELKKAYESSPLSFVYYQNIDHEAIPVLASDGFCKAVGVDRSHVLEWIKVAMFERMHPDDVGIMVRITNDFLLRHGPYDVIFRCRIDNVDQKPEAAPNEYEYVLTHGLGKWQTMPDGTQLAVVTYSNLTQTHELTREKIRAYNIAQSDRFYTDSLTALPNINYMHEFANEKIDTIRSAGKTPYLIYTDINAMQSYNNQYGFGEGDQLLRLIAETFKKSFPRALISRGADDHFILITDMDSRQELEDKLHEINMTIRKNAYGNTTGIRSGISDLNDNTVLSEGLDHAKHALKGIETNLNRDVAFFSQDADNAYWQNLYIVENFERALQNRWIKVYYHSLFHLNNNKISAFEGLARWVDPNRGTISPGVFIPVLSKYHLLYKLDLYMFEEVCREIPLRHDNNLPLLPVSINFSRQDFDHADIVSEMNRMFDKYKLSEYVDKSYFIIEITEQDLAVKEERFQEQLKRLHDDGYRIWLDDFGSGYSALNMFNRFNFDMVKFDMDLLRHLDDNGGVNRIILKELVKLVRELNIHSLIEGVETKKQLDFVKEIGFELAQGFFFSRPKSLDEILFMIRDGEAVKIYETHDELEWMSRRHD